MNEAENESDKLYKEALELANNEANASKEKARLEIESQTSAARDQLSKQADDPVSYTHLTLPTTPYV